MRDDDFVCGHLLGYASGRTNGYLYGDAGDGDIDLTDPAERERRLEAFVAMFRNAVLAWFGEASEPELIVASRAGDYTNDPVALVEWLASRGRQDLIAGYTRRYLTREAGAEQLYMDGVASARSGQPNPGMRIQRCRRPSGPDAVLTSAIQVYSTPPMRRLRSLDLIAP